MDDLSAQPTVAQRAAALHALIDGDADAAERQGRLTDSVASALLASGLLSIAVPTRHGGLGLGQRELFEGVEAIARADGSAGWVAGVCNTINLTVAMGASAAGLDEVFGHGPVSCWASLLPTANATEVEGGYRVTTNGVFGSGSSLSGWVLLATNTGGPGEGRYRAFLIPKSDVEIRDGSWDVMGLKATASADYAVREVFVPARRSWEYSWAGAGDGPLSATESVRWGALGLTAFASGVGLRAQDELIASAKKTRRTVGEGFQADDGAIQFGLGELDGRLRAARSHLLSLLAELNERIGHRTVTPEQGIALTQACQTLARASREMVLFAFDNAGTSVVYARSPLQRCLRDIFTGLKHASFTPTMLGRVGKVRLGLPFGGAPL